MPKFTITNTSNSHIINIPEPVNKRLGKCESIDLYVDNIYTPKISDLVKRGLLSITASNDIDVDNNIESVVASQLTGGGGVTWPLDAPDGTVGAPSYTFADDTALGMYRDPSVGLSFTYGGDKRLDIGEATITNLEPTPATVRYGSRLYTTDMTGVHESCGLYGRLNPTGVGNQQSLIYLEITDEQQDTEASALKIIHNGQGDAIYGALLNTGPALEAASFHNGSRNIISTVQTDNPGFPMDAGNTTLFNAVWGWDGTGGSNTPPNFGVFYSSLTLGNSFVARKQDPTAPGAVEGRTEFKISEYDFSRNRWEMYNTGESRSYSMPASVGTPQINSPAMRLVGSYWDGAAAVDKSSTFNTVVDGSGGAALWFLLGGLGAEAAQMIIGEDSIDLQGNDLVSVKDIGTSGNISMGGSTFRFTGFRTISTQTDAGNAGDVCMDTSYLYLCVSTSLWARLALSW